MKPTTMAAQRWMPAHSPSTGPASAVTTSGDTKLIAVLSESCRCWIAIKLNTVDVSRKIAREACHSGRRVT